MLQPRQLLSQANLNTAFISRSDTADQSVASNLQVGGGRITLKNSILSDSSSASYMQINPQGSLLIVYDGVTDMDLRVYSRSGTQYLSMKTYGGTDPFGQIEANGVNRLEINTANNLPVKFGSGMITTSGAVKINRSSDHIQLADGLGNAKYRMQFNESSGRFDISEVGIGFPFKLEAGLVAKTANNTLDAGNGDMVVSGHMTIGKNLYLSPSHNVKMNGTADNQEWSFDLMNQNTYAGNYWQVWSDKNSRTVLAVTGDTERVGVGTFQPAAKFHVNDPVALGGNVGNKRDIAVFAMPVQNYLQMKVQAVRTAAGTDWTTADLVIQRTTDTTDQASITLAADNSVKTNAKFVPYRMVLPVGANMYAT